MGRRARTSTASAVTVREAVDAYLAEPRAAATTRAYTTTLSQLTEHLGAGTAVADLTTDQLVEVVDELWSDRAPATWNRHLAAVRSWLAWCRRRGVPTGVRDLSTDRVHNRYDPVDLADRPAVIAPGDLAALWSRDDVGVREKALWRLLYDSAARAAEVLAIDVEDLDLPNRLAKTRPGNGAQSRRLHFQTEAARLLGDVVGGRERGPVFVRDDPPTGGHPVRLSQARAEAAFRRASGWSFQQLRHSRLTHLGQAGCGVGVLLTLSGYKRPASVRPYVVDGRVDDTVIAALLLATDPERQGQAEAGGGPPGQR